jgi:hypothetical protein
VRACPACFTRVPVGEASCPACGLTLGTVGAPAAAVGGPAGGETEPASSATPTAPPTRPPTVPPSGWVEGAASPTRDRDGGGGGGGGRRPGRDRAFEPLVPLGLDGATNGVVDDQRVEVGDPGPGTGPGALPSRRRGLIGVLVAAAVVAATAVGVQAVLGDGDDDDAGGSTPTSVAPTTAAPEVTPTSAATQIDPPSDQPDVEQAVPRRRRALPTRTDTLAVVDTGDGVVAVDLDNGRSRPLATDFARGRFSSSQFTTDNHLIMADREQVQAVPLDGGPTVALGPGCAAVASGDPGVVWITSCDPAVTPRAVEVATGLVRPDQLALPGPTELVGRASTGLIVQGPSGIYVLEGETPRRVADGKVLAVVGDRVIRAICDERLACSMSAVDLVTGAEQQLAAPPEAMAAVNFRLPPYAPQVSPDLQRVAVTLFDFGQSSVFVIDLAAGSVHTVPGADSRAGSPVAWSADGEWLLYQPDDEPVQAWRRRGGYRTSVADDLPDGRLLGTVADVDAARPMTGALRDP